MAVERGKIAFCNRIMGLDPVREREIERAEGRKSVKGLI